jgi:nitrite reductase/ring-hydroxylating ferredoxin subunit
VRHELFPLDELAPGETRAARLENVRIVVVRTPAGDVHALRDCCSHNGAQLSLGRLEQVVEGEDVGTYRLSDRYMLRCPWHGFEFDVVTGRCVADASQRVRAYPVSVEDGLVVVER